MSIRLLSQFSGHLLDNGGPERMGVIVGIMIGAWNLMSEEDRRGLEAFEHEKDGCLATSDWPGWERLLGFPLRRREGQTHPKEGKKAGYVYVMETEGGLYKIGRCSMRSRRIAELPAKMPYATSVVLQIACDDAPEAERLLHSQYAAKHVRGEWFRLDDRALYELKSYGSYSYGRFWSGDLTSDCSIADIL